MENCNIQSEVRKNKNKSAQQLKIAGIKSGDINTSNNNNSILEIIEQEFESESLVVEKRHFAKHRKLKLNQDERNSNHSSISFKLLDNSNLTTHKSYNGNIYVDKNNPISKQTSEINSQVSGYNYDSNFTFNKAYNENYNNPNTCDNGSNNSKNNKRSTNKQSLKTEIENENIVNKNLYETQAQKMIRNRNSYTSRIFDSNTTGSELVDTAERDYIMQNFLVNNYFTKKTYSFILFEINNFCFTQKDYFKNIYPEINLVMILEINDCALSQEKIFFFSSDDASNNVYYPYLKKEDLKINKYRIIKPIEMNDEEFPIKIYISFYTFTNFKLLLIGSDEIFLTLRRERELQKFNFYHNIHIKYTNKKIGNLLFNLAFMIEEIFPHQLLDEINNSLEYLTVIKLVEF